MDTDPPDRPTLRVLPAGPPTDTAGIDEAMIERLVHDFYAKIREDDLIGPIFASRIRDWDPHLVRMCSFWSSVVLSTGRYDGQPLALHLALPIEGEHFDRWLRLFGETARATCPPAAAALFSERAERIAQSIEMGLADSRGGPLRAVPRRSANPSAQVRE